MTRLTTFKNKKGYSIVEVLVSLGIMAVVITMLFNVLIVGIESSLKIIARSFVREEISSITGQITRDVRNSDRITSCGETSTQNSCEFFKNNIRYRWTLCTDSTNRVCKYDMTNSASPTTVYRSSQNVNITTLDFAQGFGVSETEKSKNILFTIIGSHTNSYVNVNNVFRQTSISTRNFTY